MGIGWIYLWAKHDSLALPHITSFSKMASYTFPNNPQTFRITWKPLVYHLILWETSSSSVNIPIFTCFRVFMYVIPLERSFQLSKLLIHEISVQASLPSQGFSNTSVLKQLQTVLPIVVTFLNEASDDAQHSTWNWRKYSRHGVAAAKGSSLQLF